MANPTFDSVALTTDAAAERIGPPTARIHTETLPGVRGEYVQTDPAAGRDITATGLYGATPAPLIPDAQTALKSAIRALQAKVGRGPAPYGGVDGHAYPSCVLKSYEPTGPMRYVRAGANYQAIVPVRAVVRDLDP